MGLSRCLMSNAVVCAIYLLTSPPYHVYVNKVSIEKNATIVKGLRASAAAQVSKWLSNGTGTNEVGTRSNARGSYADSQTRREGRQVGIVRWSFVWARLGMGKGRRVFRGRGWLSLGDGRQSGI